MGVGDTEVARRASLAADAEAEADEVPRVEERALNLLSSDRRLWHSDDLASYFNFCYRCISETSNESSKCKAYQTVRVKIQWRSRVVDETVSERSTKD